MRNTKKLVIYLSTLFTFFVFTSSQYDPEDNFLINCGSANSTTLGGRVFASDDQNSTVLSTPETVFETTSLPTNGTPLYRTARVLTGPSEYRIPIKKPGWHFVRLHFHPFVGEKFHLSDAVFSVSAGGFALAKSFRAANSATTVKEYSLCVSASHLVLNFTPSANSFAFLNALEVISLPGELLPARVGILNRRGEVETLCPRAMETVKRINMGMSESKLVEDDELWRSWEDDQPYMRNANLVVPVSNHTVVNYTLGNSTESIAPVSVYGTAKRLPTELDPNTIVNATWTFRVDSGFDYFVRFHFCDIISPSPDALLFFDVFLDTTAAEHNLNLEVYGAPTFKDVFVKSHSESNLSVSIGPVDVHGSYPNGILNGLEIMKISNLRGSLDASDAISQSSASSSSSSSIKVYVIVVAACVGAIAMLTFAVVVIRRRKPSVVHTTTQEEEGRDQTGAGGAMISRSKMAYKFPFSAIKEATDDFHESLVIGVGGFGKVYKGKLRDGTQVAVKRGVYRSDHGMADEFRTEIEMLSQFRHRHLVSLVGYCDEKNEMMIVYEYMANGSLKNHLYGSDHPKLNWRQRLNICIGAAKGIHYLHTGSVKTIIHRDVKPENILLDENLMAKVTDFGISKAGPGIDQTHVTTLVKGSFGYLDPEYLIRQQLTEKSDVYSFGVVMLEVLSGRSAMDPSLENGNLVKWAKGKLEGILDPHLADDVNDESLKKFAETVEKCLAEYGADRPTMAEALWNLEFSLRLLGNEKPEAAVKNESSSIVSEFSMVSMGDLANVSMNKVFLGMVNGENH